MRPPRAGRPPTSATVLRWRRRILVGVVAAAAALAAGNLAILALHRFARARVPLEWLPDTGGIANLRRIDDRVWGGAKPGPDGYRALVRAGVSTVVDLRAEPHAHRDDAVVESLGLSLVHLPIRDGQPPGDALVRQLLDVVRDAPGRVYVHCGAGVGRTGSATSAYLVATGQAAPRQALARSLAVGPPSLEQLAFIGKLRAGDAEGAPCRPVVVLSRALDAPRRSRARLRDRRRARSGTAAGTTRARRSAGG